MSRTVIVYLLGGGDILGSYRNLRSPDERFEIHPNTPCIIQPVNPNKKKHRDRKCLVTGKSRNGLIQVRFTDDGKYGYVDITDLVPDSISSNQG